MVKNHWFSRHVDHNTDALESALGQQQQQRQHQNINFNNNNNNNNNDTIPSYNYYYYYYYRAVVGFVYQHLLSRLMRLMNAWLFDRLCLGSLWLYLMLGTDKSRASRDDPVVKLPCLSSDVRFRCSLVDRGGLMGLPSRSNSLSSVGLVAAADWSPAVDWAPLPSGRWSWPSVSVMIWGRPVVVVVVVVVADTVPTFPTSSVSGCSPPPLP